jgi:threonine dehydratase
MNELFARIEEAHHAIRPQVAVTPLAHSPILSQMTGCAVYLKCEHLQHTGSFKFRGASNKVRLLDPQQCKTGIVTASSGNHGQGVALAARVAGFDVTVYAASSTAELKITAMRALGANVVVLDEPHVVVERIARQKAALSGSAFVHPYNDADVVAGQGTAGMEIHDQAVDLGLDLAATFVSVGGGGLISGIGTALKHLHPGIDIVGCWAANSTALYSSLKAGKVVDVEEGETIADGVTGNVEPGSITLGIAQEVITTTDLASEQEIRSAMRILAETDRWMVEGAAGVAVASMLKIAPRYKGRAVVAVLCGRNIMLDRFIAAVQ